MKLFQNVHERFIVVSKFFLFLFVQKFVFFLREKKLIYKWFLFKWCFRRRVSFDKEFNLFEQICNNSFIHIDSLSFAGILVLILFLQNIQILEHIFYIKRFDITVRLIIILQKLLFLRFNFFLRLSVVVFFFICFDFLLIFTV